MQTPLPRIFQWLILPFAFIWGSVAQLRRWWYLLPGKRWQPPVAVVCIGNLSAGGTGKTPMIKWLLGRSRVPIAVLSRGYGRRTKGFREVQAADTAAQVGDEPLEIRKICRSEQRVFVCEDRKAGIEQILKLFPACRLVIMDDGYQHLRVQAGVYVLLSDIGRPFFQDFPIPAGWLREFRFNAKHAAALIFTKCPPELDVQRRHELKHKASRYAKSPVLFSSLSYSAALSVQGHAQPEAQAGVVLVTGIAQADYFRRQAEQQYQVLRHLEYRDHEPYAEADLQEWQAAVKESGAKAILTTRKDWMRMLELDTVGCNIWVMDVLPEFSAEEEQQLLKLAGIW